MNTKKLNKTSCNKIKIYKQAKHIASNLKGKKRCKKGCNLEILFCNVKVNNFRKI